jgi:hypothetical protein
MKWILYITVLMLVIGNAMAVDLCTDSDDGPDKVSNPDDHSLTTAGTVKYGVSDYDDVCLDMEDGLMTDEGEWLKEYYCDEDSRKHTQYRCSNYGFDLCRNGKCGSTSNTSTGGNTTVVTPTPDDLCGNKESDPGEECDPPHSICFGSDMSEYGQCTANCKCKLATAEATKCGNGAIDEGETCEGDNDCEHWEYCKRCICVESPTTNKTVVNDTTPVIGEVKPEEKKGIDAQIEKKYPTKNITPVDIGNVTDFAEDPAIKATSGITKFFTGIWGWMVGLFS